MADVLLIVAGVAVALVSCSQLLSPASLGLAPTAVLIVLLMAGVALAYLGLGRRRDARRARKEASSSEYRHQPRHSR